MVDRQFWNKKKAFVTGHPGFQGDRLSTWLLEMGTVNLLDAVRLTPSARAVVVVTSDKCHENIKRIRQEKRKGMNGQVFPDLLSNISPTSES